MRERDLFYRRGSSIGFSSSDGGLWNRILKGGGDPCAYLGDHLYREERTVNARA